MSYNQKPPGTGGASGGTGPPNGPNNTQQVAKTLAGIQQQMQNFVHVQNALPQSSQADFNTLLHQQRLQNMLKQQQQHLIQQHFQHQMQQQQQQQQQQNKDRVGTEPLALTRTPAELLNKTYQQHHQQHPNGNPNASNSATLNPFQQQLQVIPPNLVQQLQAFQLQMQQHQQQQQQHHSQTQQAQHHTPPPGPLQSLPQQQIHSQSAQQKSTALTTAAAVAAAQIQQRYLSVVSAQTTASQVTGGSKVGNTAPPPLTSNQIKPPNLPPSTQITPVPANSGASQPAAKSTTTTNTSVTATAVASSTKQVSPSISLLPSKASTITTTSTPIAAHQQNKFHANKNSTPTASSAVTPTPAHVQKTTSSTVPLGGNISSLSSSSSSSPSDSTAKQNLNTDIAVTLAPMTSTKTPQKSTTIQPAKNVAPTALPSNASTIITKSQLSHGSSTTKQVTTNVPSQLPPPKSLQSVTKTSENRVENAVQNSTELTNQTHVTKPTPVQETKTASVINEASGKTDTSVAIGKVDIPKNDVITATVNSVSKATTQSTAFTSEKEAKETNAMQTKEMSKNDHIPEKANNNNVAEKDKSAVKEEASAIISHNKVVEPVKKSTKEANEEQVNQIETKSAETTINEGSTNEDITLSSGNLTPKPSKPGLDKKPLCTPESKKSSEELNSKVEKNKMSDEQSQENDEQKSNHNKDKDSFKEEDIKGASNENSETKPETITETAEAVVIQSTSNTKAKLNKESDTTENNESIPLKKPSRQSKSNKVVAPVTPPAASVQRAEKLTETTERTEKSDKNEKTEKGNSNRTPREEKRKAPKTPVDNFALSTPTTPKESSGSGNDRKSQRHRLKTILYQSPLPELAFITKLSASEASNSPKPMSGEDKLIVFYKNEYMAVRNAEGTFYLCQTMQNVYRTSPRISIRWLSEDAKDSTIYIPDFYDHTDIECVLTTVELKRIDKGHLRLPETEKARIENILKKAIDVEKGLVPRPELTEENPDGLDISLYKDESQIEKKLSGSQTPLSTARNSRRSTNANTTKSASKPNTPSKATGTKRKGTTSGGGSSAKKSKSPTKKRKSPTKRKSTRGTTSEEENETSEDHASDAEYKPSQKKSNVNMAAKASPRVQRSPLAKARVASPVASTSTSSQIKNPASKISASTPTPSRSERATKRKAVVETVTDLPSSPAKKAASSNVNSAESTPIIHPTKSNNTKGKETINNDEASSKKSNVEVSGAASADNSSLQTTQAESENVTANCSSSHSTATASRPTRSRK